MTREPAIAARERFAAAACALVGTRFRLHGRTPAEGLDCVGLVACALAASGRAVRAPAGYGLRNSTIEPHLTLAEANGFAPADGPAKRGDLLLVATGPGQHHLTVVSGENKFVHAHAGLRKIVIQPGPLPWAVLHRWRLTETG